MKRALLLLLAACNPYLTQQSVAPPGRTAALAEVHGFWKLERYTLEISEGVATALTCERGGPCNRMTITSDDPSIAEVRTGSFGVLEHNPYGRTPQATSAALVVVGKHAGTTQIHVRAKEGHRDITVTVIAPPVYGDPTTRVATGSSFR